MEKLDIAIKEPIGNAKAEDNTTEVILTLRVKSTIFNNSFFE